MNIIDTIQIKYFRSVMKVRLGDLGDLNVFTGRNDVGKSNVLRALNLFFNNHVEWQREIDFYRDFSVQRLRRVRKDTIKGKQFISVKLWFNRPSSYSGSLPKRFAVRKTWDRNSTTPTVRHYLDTAAKQGDLPTGLSTARQSLSQLLNKIQFEYVPAVRDRSYFDHLLDRLQGILLSEGSTDDAQIAGTAEALADHVDSRIRDLQSEFLEATGVHTELKPPTDVASLFRAFGVSTNGDESAGEDIPLRMRGDGIQGRYVASVLNYIAKRSGKIFVWGFEEPENSLEYGRASELASVLSGRYSDYAQVFVTSHSPAFTSLREGNVNVFRVFRNDDGTSSTVLVEDVENDPHGELLRSELGLLAIEERVHEQYTDLRQEHDEQARLLTELQEQWRARERPTLVVEGKWDRQILEEAWGRLREGDLPFEISTADPSGGGNGGGAKAVRHILAAKHLESHQLIGLFDRDKEGIRQFRKLPGYFDKLDGTDGVQKHDDQPVYGMLIPTNAATEGYGKRENLPLEFLFTEDALQQTTEEGNCLILRSPQPTLDFDGRKMEFGEVSPERREQIQEAVEGEARYYRRIQGNKHIFAQHIVPNLDDEHFRNFEPVFSLLEKLIEAER